jgi:hypothetical protein
MIVRFAQLASGQLPVPYALLTSDAAAAIPAAAL